jgi:hypothetical protein
MKFIFIIPLYLYPVFIKAKTANYKRLTPQTPP